MIFSVSDLLDLLEQYAQGAMALNVMHDQLSLGLRPFLEGASDEDLGLLSEVHSAIYEVEDGVLPEAEFKQGLQVMIQNERRPKTITVGLPVTAVYRHPRFSTSCTTGDLEAELNVA